MLTRKSLTDFREHLVGWTLRTIDDLFQGHGFSFVPIPEESRPGGQRRGLVECYYAGIDLTDPEHISRLLHVFEDVLDHPDIAPTSRESLLRQIQRDGYKYLDGRLVQVSGTASPLTGLSSSRLDTAHLEIYLARIGLSVDSDPGLAIGSSKELLEATLKTILNGLGVVFDENEDVPQLLKRCQKSLSLAPDDVATAARGADIVRRVLSNLGSVVIGVAELRNLYGSGHGRTKPSKGLTPRHARLVVSAAGALCRFLLETYDARHSKAV
jgi:hypothetical protein